MSKITLFFITTMEQNVQNVLNTLFSYHYYRAECSEFPKYLVFLSLLWSRMCRMLKVPYFLFTTMEQNVQYVQNTLFSNHYYRAERAECPKYLVFFSLLWSRMCRMLKVTYFLFTTMEQIVKNVLITFFSYYYYGAECAECPK